MLHEVLSGSSCSLLFSFGVCRYVQGRVDRCFVNRTLVATCLSLFCFLPWYEYICTPRVLVVLLLRTSDRILRHFQFSYICSHAWTLKNSTINLYGSHFFQQIITFACLNPATPLYWQYDTFGEPVFSCAHFLNKLRVCGFLAVI